MKPTTPPNNEDRKTVANQLVQDLMNKVLPVDELTCQKLQIMFENASTDSLVSLVNTLLVEDNFSNVEIDFILHELFFYNRKTDILTADSSIKEKILSLDISLPATSAIKLVIANKDELEAIFNTKSIRYWDEVLSYPPFDTLFEAGNFRDNNCEKLKKLLQLVAEKFEFLSDIEENFCYDYGFECIKGLEYFSLYEINHKHLSEFISSTLSLKQEKLVLERIKNLNNKVSDKFLSGNLYGNED